MTMPSMPQPRGAPRPVALVTGAQRGIGRAISLALARAGFDLALCDRSVTRLLDEVVAEARRCGVRAAACGADLADPGTHSALLDAAEAELGAIDCLVNNAGVSVLSRGDLLAVTPEAWDHCMDINARGTFFLTQCHARRLLARDAGPHHRSIVMITSSNARLVSANRAEYCASKAALAMIAQLFAVRLGGTGVGVYEVAPGLIETEMSGASKAHYDAEIERGWLVEPRWGRAEEVGRAVVTLAQGLLPYTVGQSIMVDGGMSINRY